MARCSQPPLTCLAAGAFAGAATIICQGAFEQHRRNRAAAYQDLFSAARIVGIFVLLVLSLLRPSGALPNFAALATLVTFHFLDLFVHDKESAAAAAAGVLMVEAATLGVAS